MRRDEFGIQADGEVDALVEQVDGDFGDGDEFGRVLHALGVHGGAEDGDALVVRGPERFQAFVALLAVVEARGHAMDPQVGILDETGRGPFAGLVGEGRGDVAVDFADLEADVVPVWEGW